MSILLWLVPALAVTCVAMVWAAWKGRDVRQPVSPEVAAERMGKALAKELPQRATQVGSRPFERSTGIAVRPTRSSGTDRS